MQLELARTREYRRFKRRSMVLPLVPNYHVEQQRSTHTE